MDVTVGFSEDDLALFATAAHWLIHTRWKALATRRRLSSEAFAGTASSKADVPRPHYHLPSCLARCFYHKQHINNCSATRDAHPLISGDDITILIASQPNGPSHHNLPYREFIFAQQHYRLRIVSCSPNVNILPTAMRASLLKGLQHAVIVSVDR
jgi:hypothetical protein